MKALILETSTEKSFFILAEEGAVKKSILLEGGVKLSTSLAKEAKLLLEGEKSPPDFVLVGQGPGSYTGTRVGIALAKGLSFGWKVPLYGFCSLKAFIPSLDGSFAVIVDAKMGGAYCLLGHKEKDNLIFQHEMKLPLEELKKILLKPILHIVSPWPQELQKKLPDLIIQEAEAKLQELALNAFSIEFKHLIS